MPREGPWWAAPGGYDAVPMSDIPAAVASALPGVPEQLVMRSASARATAQGVSTEDVLTAWGGGGSVPSGGASSPPVTSASTSPSAAPAAAPKATPKAAPASSAVVPAPIVVELPDDEEPIEPPAVAARLRRGFRFGVVLGSLGGLATGLLVLAMNLGSMGVTDGVATAAVNPAYGVFTVAFGMALTGMVISRVGTGVPAMLDRNFRTEPQPLVSSMVGLGTGGVLGAAIGSLLMGLGTADIVEEAIVHIPVGSSFLVLILACAVAGGVVGMTTQASSLPAGLEGAEYEAALAVKKRLVTGFIFPVLVLVAITVFVVSLGSILLTFSAMAPAIAAVVASSILTFAFLSGGRPRIRAGLTEVVVVLVALGVLVYFMVLITNAVYGSGH